MLTHTSTPSRNGTILGTVRLLWATSLLVAPRQILRLVGDIPDTTPVVVVRVLGMRQLLQGALEVAAWPRWRRLGVAVDMAHGASALALAYFDPRWRRTGMIDSVVATAFALTAVGTDRQNDQR